MRLLGLGMRLLGNCNHVMAAHIVPFLYCQYPPCSEHWVSVLPLVESSQYTYWPWLPWPHPSLPPQPLFWPPCWLHGYIISGSINFHIATNFTRKEQSGYVRLYNIYLWNSAHGHSNKQALIGASGPPAQVIANLGILVGVLVKTLFQPPELPQWSFGL